MNTAPTTDNPYLYFAACDTTSAPTASTAGPSGRRCLSRHRTLTAARRAARRLGAYVVEVEPGPDAGAMPGDSIPTWWSRVG